MRKNFFVFLLSLVFIFSVWGYSFESMTSGLDSSSQDTETIIDTYEQSSSLLKISQNLLSLSNQMASNPSSANIEYVNAMLRLSKDIGEMADRIGEMADRIVATELQIGVMADRILETQELQNKNVALTQANIIKTQQNLQTLLVDKTE